MLVATVALVLGLLTPGVPVPGASDSNGKTFLTVEEALELAFPGCKIERRTEYLDEREGKRVEELAHLELASRVVRPYVALREGAPVGTAYFDAHRVRTKNEVLMLVVGLDGRLTRVEVLSFAEPIEYLPRPSFYAQFARKQLSDDLERDIRGVAGATLSSKAATEAARRVLAVHRVLGERSSARDGPAVPGSR
jgi:hypothetical protein